MPDEVGPDLSALVRELLERLQEADKTLRTDARAAVKDAVMWVLQSVIQLSNYVADGSPSRITHGDALLRLALALEDRDRGIVNPVLQPTEGHGGNYLR